MKTRLAINGFGRIGRAVLKIALEHSDIEVVAINDLGDKENLAYLTRYDSVYGRYARKVAVTEKGFSIDGTEIAVLNIEDPAQLPWSDMKIDVVIEATGAFTKGEDARRHIQAGAKKVIISAPSKDEETITIVAGVNDGEVKDHDVVSNASCTTNCVTPIVAIMDEAFGVAKVIFTTIHAYTATQNLVDGPAAKDLRRGRAGAINIVPSSTGAADAVTKAYAPLQGKLDGVALRIPLPVVSLADFTFVTKRDVTTQEVEKAFRIAAEQPNRRGVLIVTDEPLVSSDFIGDPHSAIVDLSMTRVVDGNLVKVMAWYDNEWGYSNRLIEQAVALGR